MSYHWNTVKGGKGKGSGKGKGFGKGSWPEEYPKLPEEVRLAREIDKKYRWAQKAEQARLLKVFQPPRLFRFLLMGWECLSQNQSDS
jgi:hypothetical protein